MQLGWWWRAAIALSSVALPCGFARADEPPLEKGFEVLGFMIRPGVEVRVHGEYRRNPVNDGIFGEQPVLDFTPVTAPIAPYKDQALLWERVRLRLEIERGPVTAHVSFQDVRSFGTPGGDGALPGQPTLPITAPYEGYLDIHTEDRSVAFRLGRQAIEIGDGHLVGKSVDRAPGRSFDAARVTGKVGDFDLGAFAAMLVFPGSPTIPDVAPGEDPELVPGAQLYGLDGTWHIAPFFHAELTGLARVVRQPLVETLTPSDTFVASGRVFGDYRGVRYSVMGAFEGGRVAPEGQLENATLMAGAVAGRVEWQTSLPLRFLFGAQGAYATGAPPEVDAAGNVTDIGVFDPLFPDTTKNFGQSAFYGLSNLIEGGADVSIRPVDEFTARAAYRFAGLADANGPWRTGAMFPIGSSSTNTSQLLGNVIEIELEGRPWDPLSIKATYGLMLLGDAARNIFVDTRPGIDPAKAPDFAEYLGVEAALDLP